MTSGALFTILVIAIGLGVVWLFGRSRSRLDEAASGLNPGERYVLDSSTGEAVDVGKGEFEQDVHGESHYQKALAKIAGPRVAEGKEFKCKARLVREPSNPYDANAVQVIVEDRLVGYLPRAEAKTFSHWCVSKGAASVTCDALIVGGWDDGQSEGSYGIRLDIDIR